MARSEAPQDPRPYVRVSTDLPLNPKLAAIDHPAASWLYVVSLCYCGGSFTDGHFPVATVVRLAGVDMALAMALAEQGLWHLPGHTCSDCDEPKPNHAVVHDYLQHQRSAAEARDLTEKRRAAGLRGAQTRWGKPKGQGKGDGKPMANAIATGQQPAWQNDGNAMAEERRGEEKEGSTNLLCDEQPTAPRTARGTRIPEDFSATPDMVAWASAKVPHVDGRRETEKFINYWRAKSGKDATKVDWPATWRNWMLNAADRYPSSAGNGNGNGNGNGHHRPQQQVINHDEPGYRTRIRNERIARERQRQ